MPLVLGTLQEPMGKKGMEVGEAMIPSPPPKKKEGTLRMECYCVWCVKVGYCGFMGGLVCFVGVWFVLFFLYIS